MTYSQDSTKVFTDGASRGNPGPGGWGAVISHQGMVTEKGGREEDTTNNRMELTAVINALAFITASHKSQATSYKPNVTIYTDSSYVVNGARKWIHGWQKNGWMTASKNPVLNKDLWEQLVSLLSEITVSWALLRGHSGIPGNERADKIATSFADKTEEKLFHGTLFDYSVDLSITEPDPSTVKDRSEKKKRSGAKAYSYLSLVDGALMRHETWAMCEARVKGKNARFKKALSAEEEKEIVESWGYSFDDIVN